MAYEKNFEARNGKRLTVRTPDDINTILGSQIAANVAKVENEQTKERLSEVLAQLEHAKEVIRQKEEECRKLKLELDSGHFSSSIDENYDEPEIAHNVSSGYDDNFTIELESDTVLDVDLDDDDVMHVDDVDKYDGEMVLGVFATPISNEWLLCRTTMALCNIKTNNLRRQNMYLLGHWARIPRGVDYISRIVDNNHRALYVQENMLVSVSDYFTDREILEEVMKSLAIP